MYTHLVGMRGTCNPVQVDDPTKYGVVVMDEYGQVQRFVEKPRVGVGALH